VASIGGNFWRARRFSWRGALDVVTTLAMLTAATVMIVSRVLSSAPVRKPIPLPSEPVAFDGAPIEGNQQAPLGLVIFSDFQCPYCAQFAKTTLPDLKKEFVDTGRLLVAFRNLPLAIHPMARAAAEAAECASRQGRFWDAHDYLFADPSRIDQALLNGLPGALHLDHAAFQECVNGKSTSDVTRDVDQATQFGISGTPSFFLGIVEGRGRLRVKKMFSGARPLTDFKEAINGLAPA